MKKRIWSSFTMLALGAVLALSVGAFTDRAEKEIKVNAATHSVTFNRDSFDPPSLNAIVYATKSPWSATGTDDSSLSGYGHIFSNTTQTTIQFRQTAPSGVWTLAMPGPITEIVINGNNSTAREIIPWVSTDTEIHNQTGISNYDTEGTSLGAKFVGTSPVTWTVDSEDDYHFVYFRPASSHTHYINSFVISYSVENGGEPVPVDGVGLNKSATTIETGETEQLTATVSPFNATDKGVTWESTNNSAATVSQTGLVTAVSVGQTTVRVKTDDGDFEDECVVTVIEGPAYYSTKISSIGITLDTPIDLMSKGLDWTFSVEGGTETPISSGDGRGVQFGTSGDPLTSLSITSELFVVGNDALINKVKVYGQVAGTGLGAFDLEVFINGEQFGATINAVNVADVTKPTEYVFEDETGMYGHIQILYTHKTSHALYFHSVKVYAEEDVDLAAALNFANDLEGFKTCSGATEAHTALSGAYDSLSVEAKAYLNTIKLFDFDAGDTTYAGDMSLQVTAADKWAGILAVHGGAWPSPGTLLVSDSLNYALLSLLTIMGITIVIGGVYYLMLRKKKIIV